MIIDIFSASDANIDKDSLILEFKIKHIRVKF